MAARISMLTKIAAEIRRKVAAQAKALALSGVPPGIAVVWWAQPGWRSRRGKVKSRREVGYTAEQHTPSESADHRKSLLALIADLNRRDEMTASSCSAAARRKSMPENLLAVDPPRRGTAPPYRERGLPSTKSPASCLHPGRRHGNSEALMRFPVEDRKPWRRTQRKKKKNISASQ